MRPAESMERSTSTFPSLGWFRELAVRMAGDPAKYKRLGALDLTLVPRIVFPDGHAEHYSLVFEGHACRSVEQAARPDEVRGRHPVMIEGDYQAWREMVENIRRNGHADLQHTLNYLTLPDWPLRLVPLDEAAGQLDVDRFYRFNDSLQSFFDEASGIDTRYVA